MHARLSTWLRARSSHTGSTASRSRWRRPRATHACDLRCPVSTTSTTHSPLRRSRWRSASLDIVVEGLERFTGAFGRFERFVVGDKRVLLLLVKNPAGANEAIRTLDNGSTPETLVVALNDRIADGRDVSWIWDVDFEPLLERAGRIVVSGERAAELALRFAYGGFPRERLEIVPSLDAALDRGLELTRPGEELAVLPTYTAMLALQAIATRRGLTRPYWEDAA